MVTSILLRGLEQGLLDAAVVVRKDDEFGAAAFHAEDAESILLAHGTKYVRISVLEQLLEALQKGRAGCGFCDDLVSMLADISGAPSAARMASQL